MANALLPGGSSGSELSGTGCSGLLDVLLAPNVGPVKWEPGSRENPSEGYRAPRASVIGDLVIHSGLPQRVEAGHRVFCY